MDKTVAHNCPRLFAVLVLCTFRGLRHLTLRHRTINLTSLMKVLLMKANSECKGARFALLWVNIHVKYHD